MKRSSCTVYFLLFWNYFLILRILLIMFYFDRFNEKESVSGVQQLKSSVQKGIRNKLNESYPSLHDYLEKVLPKKDPFKIVKW